MRRDWASSSSRRESRSSAWPERSRAHARDVRPTDPVFEPENCRSTTMPTAQEIIAALKLQPHPIEGGFFRETYRSAGMIPVESLPPGYSSQSGRSFGTSIYYLLTADTFSEMHRLPTEEVFHLYLGGPVRMLQLFAGGGQPRGGASAPTSWPASTRRSSCRRESGKDRASSRASISPSWERRWRPASTTPTTSKAAAPCWPACIPARPS